MSVAPAETCGYQKAGGDLCRVTIGLSPSNGRCIVHDPDRIEEAKQRRSLGGKASGESRRKARAALPADVPKAPKTLEDAATIASWITRATLIGEIDARTSEAATKAVRQFQLTIEKRELVARIKALETALAEARRAA